MADQNVPGDLRYSETHEWVRVTGSSAQVGITEFAQEELGDVVYLDLPWDGAGSRELKAGEEFGNVESVKATSALNSPVSGKVSKVNEALQDAPELVNSSPFEKGWMLEVELSDPSELNSLMDATAYQKFVSDGGGH